MRKDVMISKLGFVCVFLALASCASNRQQALITNPNAEVQPQYKAEVASIYAECLGRDHGVMLQCIQKRVLAIGEDVDVLVEHNEADPNWQAPEEFIQRKNEYPANTENIHEGEEVYKLYCAMCHGADARGKQLDTFGRRSPDLTSAQLLQKSDGEIFWKITEGGWPMPAFWEGEVIDERDIWTLITYLRSLSDENKK